VLTADLAEYRDIVRHGWGVQPELIFHSPHYSWIHQCLRRKGSWKKSQFIERNIELFACMNGEIIHAFLKRNDPAVEQVSRLYQLAAKIINDENAPDAFICGGAS